MILFAIVLAIRAFARLKLVILLLAITRLAYASLIRNGLAIAGTNIVGHAEIIT